MEPTAAEVVKTAAEAKEYNLGVILGAGAVAVTFIASKWQTIIAFIRNKPRPTSLKKADIETMLQFSRNEIDNKFQKYPEREEVQDMIKEHDLAATTKTTLMLREHEKSCMQCLDTRLREDAKIEQEYRREEAKERTEFRKEMLETTRRIHDRIDALSGHK